MKLYILNGPSINLLGVREPDIYGTVSYAELCDGLLADCRKRGIDAVIRQTNHEGTLVDWIIEAYEDHADGIILNAGAYTHTSIAIPDALRAVRIPAVEVHLSDPDARENFRKVNYLRDACATTIKGKGIAGYYDAVAYFADRAGVTPCK